MLSQVYEETEALASEIKGIEGVVAIVLFGSYARKDFHEGSDVDLLVLFKDKRALREGVERVSEITSKRGLLVQVVALTLEEFSKSNMLETVLREGKEYYAKMDLRRLMTPRLNPCALITYSTANLKPKDRVVFTQRLEGRGRGRYKYSGLVQELGGYKVGRGVIMVPFASLEPLLDHFEKLSIQYVVRCVWTLG